MSDSTQKYVEFDKLAWVCDKPIPARGTEVNVRINGIGRSVVQKYFVEHGFIGLIVKPNDPPAWYIKQNGADAVCHVFPAETTELHVRNEEGKHDKEFYQASHKAMSEDYPVVTEDKGQPEERSLLSEGSIEYLALGKDNY